ncbi:MAG: 30S ribosomal protein S12 methylthiotransferase RimO [Deltaproteobacteria bacterium]|nr:30S ribosomal protein S12 methylthiotransferase RimO [Deltaproteobacteria bacterium]
MNPKTSIPNPSPKAETQSRRVYVETLGCAKNRVDSEILLGALPGYGYRWTTDPAQAEVIVVNTCAFITAATTESINRILDLGDYKTSGVCQKLVCAGCMSERYKESLLEEIPELDGVFGSSDFQLLPALLDELYAESPAPRRVARISNRPHYDHLESADRVQTTPRPYAYLKVAEGCSNMCSFCNIPFLRGMFSSRPVESIVAEMRKMVDGGVREINLVAQDISSYGVDFKNGTDLETLLKAINRLPEPPAAERFWVRLFYAYPNTFSDGMVRALADSPHVVPYLDMPFQHISDKVLKAMNRRITEKQIREKLETLKKHIPALALRTTFITGFPNESQEDFARLLSFVEEGWFDHVGVFPYSHEDNIVSARLGDPVPAKTKGSRRDQLMAAQQNISAGKNRERVGQTLEVLVEGLSPETDLLLQGRAAFQGPEVDGVVYINEGQARAGEFHRVTITEAHPYDLIGAIADQK